MTGRDTAGNRHGVRRPATSSPGWGATEDETYEAERGEALVVLRTEAALERMPVRLRGLVEWVFSRWLGRTLIRSVAASLRVEVFDRAMTIAAQFFTSVLPILILTAIWVEARDVDAIADLVSLPDTSRSIVDDAVAGADSAAFGIVGTLLVLASATSLSRALTRTYAVIWRVSRPRNGLGLAWRWLAVVLVLTMALVIGHSLTQRAGILPPREVWPLVLSLVADLAVAVFVPWVLLSGTLAARLLLPGATVFALLMLAVRPAADVWLPRALEVSADRYGPIGLAFTYLAWLYVVALVFIGAAVLGQVLASDRGRLGGWIRGDPRRPVEEGATL